MLTTTSNNFLLGFALLGWAFSLYFGFFRYRQYIWSRHKVQTDILQKTDQRRAELAAKMLLLASLKPAGKQRSTRVRSLLRRYLDLVTQITFFQEQGLLSEPILQHLQLAVQHDLKEIDEALPELSEPIRQWQSKLPEKPGFARSVTDQFKIA